MKLMTQSRAVIAAVAAGAGFICNAGTVAWYRFDEGTLGERVGSTVEIVNSANPGTLTGYCRQQNNISSPKGISDVDTGYFPTATGGFNAGNGVVDPASREKHPNGRAFSFTTSYYASGSNNSLHNGDGGCVTVQQTDAIHLSSFTVECFFKMADLSADQINNTTEQILVCLPRATTYSGGNGNYAFALYTHAKKNQVLACVCDSSGMNKVTYTAENIGIHDGKWHHVAMTFDGNQLHIYLDYNTDSSHHKYATTASGAPSYDSSNAMPLTIGASPLDWGRRFTGLIDEVRISDTVLAPEAFLRPAAYSTEIDAPSTVCHVTFDTAATEEFGFPLWKELNAVPSSGAIPAEVKWDATKGVEPELVKDSLPVIEVYNARRKFNKTLTNAVALHAPTNQPFYSASLFIDDRKNGAHAVLDGSFTFEFFARVPEKPDGVYNDSAYLAFFGKAWSGGPMSIRVHKNGGLAFCLKDQDTNTDINDWSSAGQICDNEWHHIALTYDRPVKTAKAYLDGNLVKTWDGNMNIDFKANDSDNSKMLEIGSGYGPGSDRGYSTGPWIDEFRLSNVALDPRDFLQGKQTRFTGMSVFVR